MFPIIEPNYLQHPSDRTALVNAVSYTYYLVEKTSFSKYAYVNPNPIPGCSYCTDRPIYECISYIECSIREYANTQLHPVGTVRMGDPSRWDVVVDPRLRVKGINNLRVIDSSIYDECINTNTNAASLLVGEKGAQMVYEDCV